MIGLKGRHYTAFGGGFQNIEHVTDIYILYLQLSPVLDLVNKLKI